MMKYDQSLIIHKIIMEELTLIIEQRRKSIAGINARQQRQKFQLIEEERKRNQRENWILRVLKSLKVLTIQQKRIIYETTHRIMNYYHPIPQTIPAFESANFLEVMINLFVDFFNRFESMDFTHLKAIIRPNNNYIVVDLLKTLLDLGRKEFKNAMQNRFKEQPVINRSDKKLSVRSLVRLPPISGKSRQQGSTRNDEIKDRFSRDEKLRYALLQKYGRAVESCNLEALQQRANQLYFDLIYLNNRNSTRIQRYLDACFGAKRHINYDASGLYTQQEIRKLVQSQQERATARLCQIGQLRGECSGQQLKQYFKMQVEMRMSSVGLRGFARQSRLQEWFPLCLIKNGDKLHPYHLVVDVNGVFLSIDQFELRYNKRVKVYMRQLLAQYRGQNFNPEVLHDPEYLRFPKKDFISYHQAKTLQIINQDPPTISILLKKDPILPSLPTEQDTRRKVKSESKISNKSLVMPTIKPLQSLQRELQKRMNYSSILKQGGVQRKIDSIIDKLIRLKDIK